MTQQDDLEKQAKQLGERIGFLLATSTLPDDAKEALLVLLPDMTPEQTDSMIKMLEKNIAGAAEIEAQEFIENLKKIDEQHEQKRKAAEEKAMSELEEIEKLLGEE